MITKSYEAIRSLKEAGFSKEIYLYDKTQEVGNAPTMDEIIEQIGYEGFVMWEYEGKFYAAKDKSADRDEIYYDAYPGTEVGDNPLEAVINLYLAINRK